MSSAERATVLVVEDDEGQARLQRRRLERAGYAVATAATADAGLELLRQGGIDLVVLDQNLPGGTSGLELYRQVKAAGLDVPAVLVTGMSGEGIVVQALRAGVRDFVPKTPDYLDYLLPAIARVLKERQTERELVREQAAREEAERAAAALREADRRKDEFLAMLGHELRNPLGPVRNAVHILKMVGPSDPTMQQARDMIERQVTHLSRLVDDLLDVSRITRGKIQLRKERLDLVQLVRATTEDYRSLLEATGLQLVVDLPPGPLWLQGDRTRLAQVVGNLLNNANKFTDAGGRVAVAVAAVPGNLAEVRVADTGIGMERDMLARVFETFSQADRSLDRSRGGLGLGLALVRGLVELHGGTVEATSPGPGRGSTFTVRLPLEGVPAPRPRPPVRARSDGGGRGILLIEDNRDAAESLRVLLELTGNRVELAFSGPAGVEAARRFRPDVVVCDIGLPGGMDGYAVAQALRREPDLERAYLIALTGYGQEEDVRRAREAGFDRHMTKPVEFTELQQLIAAVPGRN